MKKIKFCLVSPLFKNCNFPLKLYSFFLIQFSLWCHDVFHPISSNQSKVAWIMFQKLCIFNYFFCIRGYDIGMFLSHALFGYLRIDLSTSSYLSVFNSFLPFFNISVLLKPYFDSLLLLIFYLMKFRNFLL